MIKPVDFPYKFSYYSMYLYKFTRIANNNWPSMSSIFSGTSDSQLLMKSVLHCRISIIVNSLVLGYDFIFQISSQHVVNFSTMAS